MLPQISQECIDIYTVGQNKLVAYANYLVFGRPEYFNGDLTFKANSYIKILANDIIIYLTFIFKLFDLLNEEEDPTIVKGPINSTTFSYSFDQNPGDGPSPLNQYNVDFTFVRSEDGNVKLTFELTLSQKKDDSDKFELLSKQFFTLDEDQITDFQTGFVELCFKVFSYPLYVNDLIWMFVEKTPITFLENLTNTKREIFKQIISLKQSSVSQSHVLANCVVRHRDIIISFKKWHTLNNLIEEVTAEETETEPKRKKIDEETNAIDCEKMPILITDISRELNTPPITDESTVVMPFL